MSVSICSFTEHDDNVTDLSQDCCELEFARIGGRCHQMREGDGDVVKYDMYSSFEMEGFEESHKVLMLGLLQSLHLLVAIRPQEALDSDKLARRRLSNGHSNVTIKLELVDFLKALPRRFIFDPHVLMGSNPGISGLGKDKFLRTGSCLNDSALWRACSPSL